MIKEKSLSLTLATAIPSSLLKSRATAISSVHSCVCEFSVLESCCFWLVKFCVCSKFLHFLPGFVTTEGIRTLLVVYSLAVLYFVEGNWPSSCQHPWSQRTPQSCQGNSFCLGSCKRERDRNILWAFAAGHRNRCGPLLQTPSVGGSGRAEVAHSNIVRWSF